MNAPPFPSLAALGLVLLPGALHRRTPAAGHPEAAGVVDDDQVDAARLGTFSTQSRARTAADDRLARRDLFPQLSQNLVASQLNHWSFRFLDEIEHPGGCCTGKLRIIDVQVQLDELDAA